MDATQLMLGDWLYISDVPEQIKGVDEGFVHLEGNACEKLATEDLVKPIPLSKDLMDANFELDEGYYDEYFKEKGILPYKMLFTATYPDGSTMKNYWHLLYNTNINELRIEDDPCIYVRYVHELQHMLRLMGQRGDIKLVYNPNNPT